MKWAWNVSGNERLIQRLGSWLRYTRRHWLTKAVNFCWKFWNSRCESCSFKISWILFSGRGEPSLTCPSKLVRRLFWLLPSLSLSWPSAALCSVTCSASASIQSLMYFMAKQWWSTQRICQECQDVEDQIYLNGDILPIRTILVCIFEGAVHLLIWPSAVVARSFFHLNIPYNMLPEMDLGEIPICFEVLWESAGLHTHYVLLGNGYNWVKVRSLCRNCYKVHAYLKFIPKN